ncbi:MAG: acyltransferase family protein [Corallococcus sp.]|nr:acyltransferase family protein [Corallococcus sp.]
MLNAKTRNVYLDIFKIFLAIMPISIHFGEKSLVPFCRLAVPMFFMISGYFLYRKDVDAAERFEGAKKFFWRTLSYFFCGVLFYFIYDVTLRLTIARDENLSHYFMYMFLPDILTSGLLLNRPVTTGFHLWFLLAMLDVALVHLALTKLDKTNLYSVIVPVGFALFFFFGEYAVNVVDVQKMPVEYYRNGLIFGLPCAALGYCLARSRVNERKFYAKWIYLFVGAVFFALQYAEAMFQDQECYIASIFAAAFLLLFFTSVKPAENPFFYKYVGASAPYYIYVIHIAVGNLLPNTLYSTKTENVLVTFMVSFALYEFCHLLLLSARYLRVNRRRTVAPQQTVM